MLQRVISGKDSLVINAVVLSRHVLRKAWLNGEVVYLIAGK